MQNTIINNIYEIFQNFFGKEFVDLQLQSTAAFIYVWWPKVTVSNEYNKSIDIQDLYAKIKIDFDGTIPYEEVGFLLNRATYDSRQFDSSYMHSHIQSIPKGDFTCFMTPCLGRGPIRNTINSLKTDYDETLWMLFCQELALYVTVESIAGVPWKRLERVGKVKPLSTHQNYTPSRDFDLWIWDKFYSRKALKSFIEYYLKHGHLTFYFTKGAFCCGMPYFEYIIDISNAFIDFYNKSLKSISDSSLLFQYNFLNQCIVKNGMFYGLNNRPSTYSYSSHIGKKVLSFKGKDILLKITDCSNEEQCTTIILSHFVAMYILEYILKVINFRFKNANKVRLGEENSPTYKRVLYV